MIQYTWEAHPYTGTVTGVSWWRSNLAWCVIGRSASTKFIQAEAPVIAIFAGHFAEREAKKYAHDANKSQQKAIENADAP